MSSTVIFIDLLGAAALLIWGLRMLKSGMERVFGTRLRFFLAAGTRNRFMAFGVGLLMTMVLQSSTATAIMTSSFVGQGLISLAMSQAVMLGADVGTSLVTQLLSFRIYWLSSALLLSGVVTLYLVDTTRGRGVGRSLVGLGLMLLSLRLMGEATGPMRSSFAVQILLGMLGDAPLFAMIATALLAAVAASSLAVVLFVMSLATAGAIDPTLCVLFVVGANLGGAFPPLLAAGSDAAARRVVVGNLCMRACGALLVLIFSPFIGDLVGTYGHTPRFAVDVHVAFNVALAILFLPLVTVVASVVRKILPILADSPDGPKHLVEEALSTPTAALAAATRETLRIGDTVERMIEASLGALRSDDERLCMTIKEMDNKVDRLQEAVKLYLSRLGRGVLDEEQSRRSTAIISYAINLEHIGDIVEQNLSRFALKKIRNQLMFSTEGFSEIEKLYLRTLDNLHLAQTIFMARDEQLARKLVESKVDIRHMEQESSDNHLRRLREGRIKSMQTSALHLDILRDLKRVNAHITSVSYPILDELGVLRESRLRKE